MMHFVGYITRLNFEKKTENRLHQQWQMKSDIKHTRNIYSANVTLAMVNLL